MKNLRLLTLILILCLAFSSVAPAAYAIEPPLIKSADAILVVDMNSGSILYELNKDMHHSIASLTKIMTGLLAIEAVEQGKFSLTDMITAGEDCRHGLDISSSNAGITPGETMSYEDLLYCALVHSANEACNVLAAHIAGSVDAFVEMMNARAKELGCNDTNFIDVNGMLNRGDDHYSTPHDLYLITREAMSHQLFVAICNTADYTVTTSSTRPAFDIHNSNALICETGLYGGGFLYEGVIGVKTGFTKPAGYCLISTCRRDNVYIMVIVLGCNGALTYTRAEEYQNFVDTISIYDWAFKNYSTRIIFLAEEPLKRFPVENAKDDATVALCPVQKLELLLPKDLPEEKVVVNVQPHEGALVAPIEKGQVVGVADVIVDGEKVMSIPLAADADVELTGGVKFKQGIGNFFGSKGFKITVTIIICLGIALFIIFILLKNRRRHKLRRRIVELERRRAAVRMDDYRTTAGSSASERGYIRANPPNSYGSSETYTSSRRKLSRPTAPAPEPTQDWSRFAFDSESEDAIPLRRPRSVPYENSAPAEDYPERSFRSQNTPYVPIERIETPSGSSEPFDLDEILRSFRE